MPRKTLPFTARAALALLSGLAAWPAIRLDALIAPVPLRIHPGWGVLYATVFALSVLSPFLGDRSRSPFRLALLVAGTIVVCHAAFRLPLLLDIEPFGAASPFLVSGVSAAGLLALLTWLVAPLAVSPRFWSLSIVAGGAGGLIVYQVLVICEQGRCLPATDSLAVVLGWAGWQLLVFLAMYVGSREAGRKTR